MNYVRSSSIGGGYNNNISFSGTAGNGGGFGHLIGGGWNNSIYRLTALPTMFANSIVGGDSNKIIDASYSLIGGGKKGHSSVVDGITRLRIVITQPL